MRVLVATIAVGMLLTGGAEARTVIVDRPNMQAWVDRARVPTPDETVTVVRGDTVAPCGEAVLGCVNREGRIIYLDPSERSWTFFHETGHLFDWVLLNDRDREWFAELDGQWDIEVFADHYAHCARGKFNRKSSDYSVGHISMGRHGVLRACRKIERIYARESGRVASSAGQVNAGRN